MQRKCNLILITISLNILQIAEGKVPSCHISIWDGFCRSEIFYEPYIHIWQGGKTKELLRARGPGFIDVSGLRDIYICTNGLVMHYYANTKNMGNLLEEGHMKWVPHHCALYNPSCGPGAIQPFRHLYAILLIGHPKDYRHPALQMFMSPYYDAGWSFPFRKGEGYMNLTSLVMISDEGECLIDKGNYAESIIRVQVNHPEHPNEMLEKHKKATKFCRLDATKYMGETDEFDEALAVVEQIDPKPISLNQARNIQVGTHKGMMFWLSNEVQLKFKGCLRYPLFNLKQRDIIIQNAEKYSDTEHVKFKPLEMLPEYNPKFEDTSQLPSFWAKEVRGIPRYQRPEYDISREVSDPASYETEYEQANATWREALEEYKEKLLSKSDDLKEAEEKEFVAWTSYQLFPLMQDYVTLLDDTKTQLQNNLKVKWTQANETMEELNVTGMLTEYEDKFKRMSEIAHEQVKAPYDVNLANEFATIKKEADTLLVEFQAASNKLARLVTIVETLTVNYWRQRKLLPKIQSQFEKTVKMLEKRQTPKPHQKIEWPMKDVIVSMMNIQETHDYRICDVLPAVEQECLKIRPTSHEAYALLRAVKGQAEWETPEDAWRDDVFKYMEKIFNASCPYLEDTIGFVREINNVIKSYLVHDPYPPYIIDNFTSVNTFRDYNHTWKSYILNETIKLSPNLTAKRPMWDIILDALETCSKKAVPLEFWAESVGNEDGDMSHEMYFKKFFKNNQTSKEYYVKELFMDEQADKEYVFNWAIDMNWKIFATVLGTCFEFHYEKQALINSNFYSMYYEDFLHPLRQNWMSNYHNPVFKVIFGKYYPNGKADRWTSMCMESSFVKSGDRLYRPLRWLLVNSFSELNFFASGPMVGTSGRYFNN